MDERQEQIWDMLCEQDGETVARLFTDYFGNQLLNDGFREFLQDEGYMEPDEELEDNCENGVYNCDTCINNGDCLRQGEDGQPFWLECGHECNGCLHRESCDDYDPDGWWVISRPILGVTLNGDEYVLDDDGEIMTFQTEKDAKDWLKKKGVDAEDEGLTIKFLTEEELEDA